MQSVMGLATAKTADTDLEARTDEGEDSSAPLDGCIPCRIPFRISSSSPIPETRHIPQPPGYKPASDDRRYPSSVPPAPPRAARNGMPAEEYSTYRCRIPPIPSLSHSPLRRATDAYVYPLNPPPRAARNGMPAQTYTQAVPLLEPPPRRLQLHAYDAPWVSVASLGQMDGEFSFLQRLADYGMIGHLAYKTSAVKKSDGTETPSSVGGITVSRGDRLTDFYTVMHAAVQRGVPFAYHFSLERDTSHLR